MSSNKKVMARRERLHNNVVKAISKDVTGVNDLPNLCKRTGKVCYPDELSASLIAVVRNSDISRFEAITSQYFCQSCGYWHIGRPRKGQHPETKIDN